MQMSSLNMKLPEITCQNFLLAQTQDVIKLLICILWHDCFVLKHKFIQILYILNLKYLQLALYANYYPKHSQVPKEYFWIDKDIYVKYFKQL